MQLDIFHVVETVEFAWKQQDKGDSEGGSNTQKPFVSQWIRQDHFVLVSIPGVDDHWHRHCCDKERKTEDLWLVLTS